MFGVKIADLKMIAKKIRGDQSLACELYETGNADAMYLAGIVADGSKMSKKQLEAWAKGATWHMLSDYTVPGVAAESPYARELAIKWIRSNKASIASGGWCTYAGLIATKPDEELNLMEVEELLNHIVDHIHAAPNKVRYTMNAFVIAVGTYIKPLLKQAKAAAKKIGAVSVDMGNTSCKVPLATAYIEKVEKAGTVGKKRKTIKC
jgi:3-methyladenine DNA glycosylase AlkD